MSARTRTPRGGRPRSGPRSGKSARRREKLLTVALELFSGRDFASVTIKDIGRAAGTNSALIYYYFRDKTDLLRASLDYAVNLTLENYVTLTKHHSDPADLLRDWFENNIELAKPIRQVVKIMLDYSTSNSRRPVIDAIIRRFYVAESRILSSAIEAGIAAGTFRKLDAGRAAQIASTYLDGIMVRSIVRKNFDIRHAIDELTRIMWEHLDYAGQPAVPARKGSSRAKRRRHGASPG